MEAAFRHSRQSEMKHYTGCEAAVSFHLILLFFPAGYFSLSLSTVSPHEKVSQTTGALAGGVHNDDVTFILDSLNRSGHQKHQLASRKTRARQNAVTLYVQYSG